MRIAYSTAALGLAGLLASAVVAPASAADLVADFYKGKNITLYIGYSPGGGYDTYARTIARHMGKYIPGNPAIVPKNRPGAGSLLIANELYNKLPKDGTALAAFGRGVPMEPLLGNKQAKFKPNLFTWLGSANNEVSTCVSWHTSKVKTFEDSQKYEMVIGGTGPGADTDVFPTVMNNILGTKFKLITGYPGGNDVLIAMERGELEGRCGYSWSSVKSRKAAWLRDKKINVFVQLSTAKHPDIPDVPFIMDLAKTEKDKQVLAFIFARQAWGRPLVAPPGLPADRTKALQDAFMATMKDSKFLADAKKQNLEISPIDGAEISRLIAEVAKSSPDVIRAAKEATEKVNNIKISKAVIPIETKSGEISKVGNGGREVSFKIGSKTKKVAVSGSGTKVSIMGKKADRKTLKPGMKCSVSYQGGNAKEISCK